MLKVVKNKVLLYAKFEHSEKSEILKEIVVGTEYPKLTIDRKNSKLITVDFGQGEQAQLQLQNHRIRDVLYLLIQRIRERVGLNEIVVEN